MSLGHGGAKWLVPGHWEAEQGTIPDSKRPEIIHITQGEGIHHPLTHACTPCAVANPNKSGQN